MGAFSSALSMKIKLIYLFFSQIDLLVIRYRKSIHGLFLLIPYYKVSVKRK